MKLDNKKLIYLGAGVLLLLIIVNSTKPLPLKEVQEEKPETKNFDSNSLPFTLKPPTKLSDSEPLPTLNIPKKNFLNIAFKPRFDT